MSNLRTMHSINITQPYTRLRSLNTLQMFYKEFQRIKHSRTCLEYQLAHNILNVFTRNQNISQFLEIS